MSESRTAYEVRDAHGRTVRTTTNTDVAETLSDLGFWVYSVANPGGAE